MLEAQPANVTGKNMLKPKTNILKAYSYAKMPVYLNHLFDKSIGPWRFEFVQVYQGLNYV